MDEVTAFRQSVESNVQALGEDSAFRELNRQWLIASGRHKYAHNFSWLGRPVIQIPQDLYAVQELVWAVRPDLIVETGIAHGGSLIMSASMLALLDYCDAVADQRPLDVSASNRKVVGIDIDIRRHNRVAIEDHPMAHKIHMIENSSIDPSVAREVRDIAGQHDTIMVFLDSNHTHDHVLEELKIFAPLTSVGSYCVVWDTGIEDMPDGYVVDRPWSKGNNPKTALFEYLRLCDSGLTDDSGHPLRFELDKSIESKLGLTASWDGFLKRV